MVSKCCNSSVHTEVKGSQVGIYCDDCGKWQKWASKDEVRTIEYNKPKVFNNKIEKPNILEIDYMTKLKEVEYYVSSIKRMISDIDNMIEVEDDRPILSVEDSVRKASKCYELTRVKFKLQDILELK